MVCQSASHLPTLLGSFRPAQGIPRCRPKNPAGARTESPDHPPSRLFGIGIRITHQTENGQIVMVYVEQPWQRQSAHFVPASSPCCWISFAESARGGMGLTAPPNRPGCTPSTRARPPNSPGRCPRPQLLHQLLERSRPFSCWYLFRSSSYIFVAPCRFKGYVCRHFTTNRACSAPHGRKRGSTSSPLLPPSLNYVQQVVQAGVDTESICTEHRATERYEIDQ